MTTETIATIVYSAFLVGVIVGFLIAALYCKDTTHDHER